MLSESKLAIVHCAGHYDPMLIESLWKDIIEEGNYISIYYLIYVYQSISYLSI